MLIKYVIFRGLHQQGYLLEARFSIEESAVSRGQWFEYQYVVHQRQKTIEEIATRRCIQIPLDSQVKGKKNFFLESVCPNQNTTVCLCLFM